MLIVFTGNGKGKTSAAFGTALRALGWGKKVLIIQFVKSKDWPEGAVKALKKAGDIEVETLGSGFVGIMGDKKNLEEHKKSAEKALERAKEIVESGEYDIVILDEILGALHSGLIDEKEFLHFVETQHFVNVETRHGVSQTDLILTGRCASKKLIELADLVTEMREVKHPFQKGIGAKKGIDY